MYLGQRSVEVCQEQRGSHMIGSYATGNTQNRRVPRLQDQACHIHMAATGIRIGAWDYLQYEHITPIEQEGKIVAARVLVYAESPDCYRTFMIPEAFKK